MSDDQPMTPKEAAEWLKLGKRGKSDGADRVKRLAKEGQIAKVYVAGELRFMKKHLIEYLDRSTMEASHATPRCKRLLAGHPGITGSQADGDLRPQVESEQNPGNGGMAGVDPEPWRQTRPAPKLTLPG